MKTLYSIPLLVAAALCAAGCDNDSDKTLSPLPDKTYSGTEALDIDYNDADMNGKSATLTRNGSNAVITFDSKVDLSQISDLFKGMQPIPGPGVLPGTPVLSLPVSLVADGDEYSFSGKGETDFVTYTYSGDVSADKLDFDFENVMLKNQRLANTAWKPAPLVTSGLEVTSSPLHIVWESSFPAPLEGFDGSIQDALTLLSVLPIIPVYNNTAYMSVAQALASSLKSVGFNPDGNAVVTYLQTVNGAAQFAQAPKCMIQYLPLSDTMMKLFVNPTDLMGQILVNGSSHPDLPPNPFGKASRADSGTATIESMTAIIQALAPMIAEGFPMQYTLTPGSLQIFLNSDVLLPLVKGVILPILNDPIIKASIIEKLKANAQLQSYFPMFEKFMEILPAAISATTRIELGINLVKY